MKNAYSEGAIEWEDIKIRIDSWLGHARQAESTQLIKRLSREWKFKRGEIVNGPCSPRRLLVRQSVVLSLCESRRGLARRRGQRRRFSYCLPALSRISMPGIAWFKDRMSVALKVLVSFLSHQREMMAEFTLYNRIVRVALPKVLSCLILNYNYAS